MKLKIGDKAPTFSTFDSERQPISSESLKGQKFILLFIPAAFTSTCTKEFCGIRDDISRYNNLNVKVIGMSTDSVYVLKKYKEELMLNFTLASDFNKEICGAYESQYETFNFGMKGVAKRSAFVVDENGIIQYAEVLDNASLIPDFDAINVKLETLVLK